MLSSLMFPANMDTLQIPLLQQILAFEAQNKSNRHHDWLYAMICALTPEQRVWLSSQDNLTLEMITILEYLAHPRTKPSQPVAHYMPESDLLYAYHRKGYRMKARKEIHARMSYLSDIVQCKILIAFLADCQTDRRWALTYLNDHWNPAFLNGIIRLFEQHPERESARLIYKYAGSEYVAAHMDIISDFGYYVPARLRLPKDAPIDRSRITPSEYLYLAAKLGISVTDQEAHAICEQVFANISLSDMGIFIWSLGQLKCLKTLLWLATRESNGVEAKVTE